MTAPRRRLLLGFPWLKDRAKTTGSAVSSAGSWRRWLVWIRGIRLPSVPYPWLIVGLAFIGIAQQALLYSRYNPSLTGQPAVLFPTRLVLPLLLVYMAVALRILKRRTAAALSQLQAVVELEPAQYAAFVRQILQIPRWHPLLCFAISFGIAYYVFVVRRALLTFGMYQRLPSDWPAAILVLGTLILNGGLVLYLVYVCVRYSLGLRRLAHQKLAINVLDPYALLPFGQLALLYSLTLVGYILLIVIPVGLPEAFEEYLVVFLVSLGSLWTLIGPLWGVHLQIRKAKRAVLERLHDQFRDIQETILDGSPFENEELDDLSSRAEKLTKLRTMVWEAPNWPFRTSAGVVRAVFAALTPLTLVVLQEIVKSFTTYWMNRPP